MKRKRVKDIKREDLIDAMLTPRTLATVAMELGFSSAAIGRLWTLWATDQEREERAAIRADKHGNRHEELTDDQLAENIAAARAERLANHRQRRRDPILYHVGGRR